MIVIGLFKRVHRWFIERNIVEDVAIAFTFITIINSFMMVVGWDQPKEDAFAYVHLIARLAIIIVVIGVWEYEVILGEIRAWFKRDKTSNGLRNGKQIKPKMTKMTSRSCVSLVSIVFTAATILISIVNILFLRIIEPAGGEELYRNLLFLFGLILTGVLAFSMYKRLGAKEKKQYKK